MRIESGSTFTVSNSDGTFKIKVSAGDELMISHKDFQTVYHTITNDDRIKIEVEPGEREPTRKELIKEQSQLFERYLDSAKTHLKLDAEKSINYVTEALKNTTSQTQSAKAYEILGDLFYFWKQYDLSINNYKISLQNVSNNNVVLKLAKTYTKNQDFDLSIETLQKLNAKQLSTNQKVRVLEAFGDTYMVLKDYDKALSNYESALSIAEKTNNNSKQTDITSKIAKTYDASGDKTKAKTLFNNALNLAEKQELKRSVEEKVTIAEFNNTTRNYEDEIALRKQVVEALPQLEKDTLFDNESAMTPQKQNYKIGNAYYLRGDNEKAIPYLEKSIQEAEVRSDLNVKKDGLKKLTDVYERSGDFENAKLKFEEYMQVVDELYVLKEQELAQAARFTKRLAENQSRIAGLENERKLTKTRMELAEEKNKTQQILIYSLIFGLVLLSIAAFFSYKSIKQQRFANNVLALKSLRSQMNPHFIFNALNSVNSFIAVNDERTANKYLSDFSYLMRSVLENSEEDFIPLQKEIDLIELYLRLEHFRFRDKFNYSLKVDDSIDIDAFLIPPMLLQPYIENAVWHGLRYKKEKGQLIVHFKHKTSNTIEISISDDGIGRTKSKALKTKNQKSHNSKGMTNIKKRVAILNKMYKDKVDVEVKDFKEEEDVGTEVIITLKKD